MATKADGGATTAPGEVAPTTGETIAGVANTLLRGIIHPGAPQGEAPESFDDREVTVEGIKNLANYFEVSLSPQGAQTWQQSLASGGLSLDDLLSYFREQAKVLYPQFAPLIEKGIPPRDLLSPFRSVFQQEMGDLTTDENTDDFIRYRVGQYPDTVMWRNYIRTLPEWENGPAAHRLTGDLMSGLGVPNGAR